MINEYWGRLRSRPMLIIALVLVSYLIIRYMTGGIISCYQFEDSIGDGADISFSGQVSGQELKDNKTILTLENTIIQYESKSYSAGKILFYTSDDRFHSIGATIKGQGKLKLFKPASNPGQFDEYTYYKSLKINARVSGQIVKVNKANSNSYLTALASLRRRLSGTIDKSLLSDSEASIVKTMLLGEKTAMDQEQKQIYKDAGIIHLLSISGLHISIIGLSLYKLLRKRGFSFLLCAAASGSLMISYVLMTGAAISSLRALIMFIIQLIANILGRSTDHISSLALAATILMLTNQAIILNPSFVLSFVAVLGVSTIGETGKELMGLYKGRFKGLLASLAFSGALFFFTLPVTLYFYYEIPSYSILVNLLVIPFAPLILIGSILGGLTGLIPLELAQSLSRGIFMLPKGILMANDLLVRSVAKLPSAVTIFGQPNIYLIVIYYLIILGVAARLKYYLKNYKEAGANAGDEGKCADKEGNITENKYNYKATVEDNKITRRRLGHVLISSVFMFLIGLFLITYHPRTNTIISLIDVGQGDCILIRCASGENILVDGGSSSISQVGSYRIVPCLKSLGISRLNRVILTHPDNDHINGINEILASSIKVDELNIAKIFRNDSRFLELGGHCKIRFLSAGDAFDYGKTSFTVLNPEYKSKADSKEGSASANNTSTDSSNEGSIVLYIREDKLSGLLTGDVEGAAEEKLAEKMKYEKIDFLKVAHHGSKNSTGEDFINKTRPLVALISAGKNNRYGHPHKETIERLEAVGSKYFNTSNLGMISIKLNYDYITVRGWLEKKKGA